MRLMEQIQKQFAQEIPLSTLFLAPTIALQRTRCIQVDSLPWSPWFRFSLLVTSHLSSASIQSWVLSFLITNWHII